MQEIKVVKCLKKLYVPTPKFIVIGYYTVNTLYEDEADYLEKSLQKLRINYHLKGIQSFGNWNKNTYCKANLILEFRKEYPGIMLVYTDADSVFLKYPVLFDKMSKDINIDIACHYRKNKECLSGTVVICDTSKAKECLEKWIEFNIQHLKENNNSFEQKNLDLAIKNIKKLHFQQLPPEYTFIYDAMRKEHPNCSPVIEHYQASRRIKRKGEKLKKEIANIQIIRNNFK